MSHNKEIKYVNKLIKFYIFYKNFFKKIDHRISVVIFYLAPQNRPVNYPHNERKRCRNLN